MSARTFSIARFGRLCMKELRESLRDRRTVITLVLMPLLIYPLLSLVLNRVLLSNVSAKARQIVTIGMTPEVGASPFPEFIRTGWSLLADKDHSPVFLEPVYKASKNQLAAADEEPESALPEPKLMVIDQNITDELTSGTIDLVVLRKLRSRAPVANPAQPPSPQPQADSPSTKLPSTPTDENLSPEDRARQERRRVRREIDEQFRMALGDYELQYRVNDPASERALQVIERAFSAFNNAATRTTFGESHDASIRLVATPVSLPSNYADMLATMIPLVLVLMTMAGAVYPAIDLTAGERERGTMEALVVSPTPSYVLLLAKYSAVVTVSLLTALANLLAMTITLWASGIGRVIFGQATLSTAIVGEVLALLILFTTFFSALLLAITSFAKSFKEAQAYLIPVMLLALTPGVLSLLPGIRFTNLVATIPLVNIVLLARQLLTDSVEWNTALVAVICTGIYAATALAVASRLFGSDASMQGSQGSWRDLLSRPAETSDYPKPDQMAMTMAVLFPLYFVASSVLPGTSQALATRLAIAALVSFTLILGLPVIVSWFRRLNFRTTFRLYSGTQQQWMMWLPAMVVLGLSTWTIAHEVFYYSQMLIGTIDANRLGDVAKFANQLRELPLVFVLFVFAITPAVCEEFFFRGFVLGSLHRLSTSMAIIVSSVLFGLMHVLTSNVLMVERFLPTALIGVLLAVIALRTGSIWPGMIFHAIHNGLQFTLNHYRNELREWDYMVEEGAHLPTSWLIAGVVATAVGISLLMLGARGTATAEVKANSTASNGTG
jgi:sodium transport system permease protein